MYTHILLLVALLCILIECKPLHRMHKQKSTDVRVYTTSKSGSKLKESSYKFSDSSDLKPTADNNVDIVITFNTDDKLQSIIGFGGAVTEASATTIQKLSKKHQYEIVDALYGRHGNQYSLLRVPMNSCDFSIESYSYDDTVDDFELDYFDTELKHDVENNIIPFIQHAQKTSIHPLNIYFSPWSPPAWLKGNNAMTHSSSPCLKSEKHAATWANYYVKYIEAMYDYGIEFYGLTVQNEPMFDAPWDACTYTAEEQTAFIRDHLGPTLKDNKLSKDLKLYIYDHNKDHVVDYTTTVMSDSTAAQYVDGVAIHWYSGDEFDNVEELHTQYPKLDILPSEACVCPYEDNNYSGAEKYVHDIIGDLNHWANGWTDWNIVLDTTGGPNHLGNLCGAGIIADTKNDKILYQPSYYAMAHFSRFLPPGSVRISHSMQFGSDSKRDYAYSNQPAQQEPFTQPDQKQGDMPWQSGEGIGIGLEWVAFSVDPDIIHSKHHSKHSSDTQDGDEEIVLIIMNPTDKDKKYRINGAKNDAVDIDIEHHSFQTVVLDIQAL